jgi:crotonobetainyl-CoA:carnitine CoA-transferase CaiB-like acyl-CoA transferase
MLVGNAYSYSDDFNSYAGKPPSPLPDEQQLGLGPLYRLYPARSGWVFLAAPTQSEWIDLCRLTGLAADDPRYVTPEDRAKHAEELTVALTELFSSRTAREWEDLLATKGIGCVEVNTAPFAEVACTDPGLRATGHMVDMDHPVLGRLLRHGLPQRFSETPGRLATGCWAGQHTTAVLEELGYSRERIVELEALGVTASRRDRRAP